MWAGCDLNRVVRRGFGEKVPFKGGKSEPCGYQGARILSKGWSIKASLDHQGSSQAQCCWTGPEERVVGEPERWRKERP